MSGEKYKYMQACHDINDYWNTTHIGLRLYFGEGKIELILPDKP